MFTTLLQIFNVLNWIRKIYDLGSWFKRKFYIKEESATHSSDDNQVKSFHIDRSNTDNSYSNLPDFSKMSKLDIDVWGRKELNLKLDRRKTKENMIKDIMTRLKKKEEK